jgi:hypothetical protein
MGSSTSLPPPYSAAGRAPAYTPFDPHGASSPPMPYQMGILPDPSGTSIDRLPAQPSSVDDFFAASAFDRVFVRLETEFAKLATEKAELQASKVEQSAKVASDEVKLGRIRAGLSTMQRNLNGQREVIQAEKTLLAAEEAKMARDRQVAATQYAAAANIQEGNEMMHGELVELARRLEVREKSLREKEEVLVSSSSAADQDASELPPGGLGLAANFPLTIEQDTLPGLHSEVPAVTTQTIPPMPFTGTHTLRRSPTVVHRVSYNNLALREEQAIFARIDAAHREAVQREAAEESITGNSPVKQADEETIDGAQLCELRHTSSERRDMQRGRSIRRLSGTLSLRDRALRLD